jgi:hypothetical protein
VLVQIILSYPAAWGFLGAICFAVPHWRAAIKARNEPFWCTVDLFIGLLIGTLIAGLFGPAAADYAHLTTDRNIHTICAAFGLLANPAGPKITKALSTVAANVLSAKVLKLLGGGDGGNKDDS